MANPHVLHLIDGLNIGGAEMLLCTFASGLQQRGYRISVGYSTPGPLAVELSNQGIPITQLPRLARIDPTLLINMVQLIRRDPPDIVHTHLFKSDFHGRLAARISGVPVVVSTLHNSDHWARRWPFGPLYGATARFADKLIAVSDEVGQYHLTHSGISPEKIQTIPNGVDVQRFAGQWDAGKVVRHGLNLESDAVVFGIIGRLMPQKDHDTFLLAAAEISRQMPSARFLVVGDGPLRKNLETQAQNLGLTGVLQFTGVRNDIPAVLGALDVLVFSSLWEGLPVTLLEGMSASLPVVATAVDGIKSVVLPDVTANLVATGDHAALAAAALVLGKNPELRQKMGQAAYERVTANFSLEKMIDQIHLLYMELLQARGLGEIVPPNGHLKSGKST